MMVLVRARMLLPLLMLAASACAGGAEEPPAAAGTAATPQPIGALAGGDPLPEATFPTLADQDVTVSTSDLVGTPMIINFWATWCAFCVDEMPDLERAHQALGDAVSFVGIDRQDDREKALALAEETGVTYQLLYDHEGGYFAQVKARGMPTTLFVDADGVIQHRHAGPITAEQLVELVEEKLGIEAPNEVASEEA